MLTRSRRFRCKSLPACWPTDRELGDNPAPLCAAPGCCRVRIRVRGRQKPGGVPGICSDRLPGRPRSWRSPSGKTGGLPPQEGCADFTLNQDSRVIPDAAAVRPRSDAHEPQTSRDDSGCRPLVLRPRRAQAPRSFEPFNGLDMNLGNLSRTVRRSDRARSARRTSPARRGRAAWRPRAPTQGAARELGQGWKVSP